MEAEEYSTGVSVYGKLHMHQLNALMSEQINIHGNNHPPPAASLRPGGYTPAPPVSLILLIHFPAFNVAY